MDGHNRLLTAFLAGELDPGAARQWDEHLLECERCWIAVREDRAGRRAAGLLRQPAPFELADRVTFAVEMADPGQPEADPGARRRRFRRHGRPVWRRLAGAGAATGLVIAVVLTLLPGQHAPGVPASVAAVARYAQALPSPDHGRPTALPVQVGHPVTLTAGGQQIAARVWRVGRAEAVVATSARPFPMPSGARGGSSVSGGGMAWWARLGKVGLYCVNGRTSELIAAAVSDTELAALAARLPAT